MASDRLPGIPPSAGGPLAFAYTGRVRLYTERGEYVATIATLPWVAGLEPKVVVWGARMFVRSADAIYREGFCFWSPFPEAYQIELDIAAVGRE